MVTDRDIAILHAVARFYVLSRAQITDLCFPADSNGRVTRRRLQKLITLGLLSRMKPPMFNPRGGDSWPAYYPSKRGCEVLAEVTGDDRFLAVPTQQPMAHHLEHWLAISDTHMRLESAIAKCNVASLAGWINEWDAVNPNETAPEKRYRLYTKIPPDTTNKNLVCAPDAAFLLTVAGHSKIFYLEQDRNTSGARQVAASKSQGYHSMANRLLHRRHFPTTTLDSFNVLLVTTNRQRVEALRKAFSDVSGKSLWRFSTVSDTTPEQFLTSAIWFPVDGDPAPLVKPEFINRPQTQPLSETSS